MKEKTIQHEKENEDQSEIISHLVDSNKESETHSIDGKDSNTIKTIESDVSNKKEPLPEDKSNKYDFSNMKKTEHRVIYMGPHNAQLERFIDGIDGNLVGNEKPWQSLEYTEIERYYFECPSEMDGHSNFLEATLLFNVGRVPIEPFLEQIRDDGFFIYTSGRGFHRPYRCCLLAFDVTSRESFEALSAIHQDFSAYHNERGEESGSRFILVGTVPSSEKERNISTIEAESFASSLECPYFEIKEDSSPKTLLSLQNTIFKLSHDSITREQALRAERSKQYRKERQRKKLTRCTIM